MTSIGTLFAFILVCIGVWVMRKKMPELPRAFKTPMVPLVPILGIVTCLFMMVFLPMDTWIRLLVWMFLNRLIEAGGRRVRQQKRRHRRGQQQGTSHNVVLQRMVNSAPQFVRSSEHRGRRLVEAPWRGGGHGDS